MEAVIQGQRLYRGYGEIQPAAMMGFTVLRFSTEQVKAGVAIKQIGAIGG